MVARIDMVCDIQSLVLDHTCQLKSLQNDALHMGMQVSPEAQTHESFIKLATLMYTQLMFKIVLRDSVQTVAHPFTSQSLTNFLDDPHI